MSQNASRHGFIAYIDESGQEGGKDNPLSSDYFIVSAIVARTTKGSNPISDAFDKAAEEGNFSHRRLKKYSATKNRNQRLLYCKHLGRSLTRHAVVICHKQSFWRNDLLTSAGDLYWFASMLILERISWICRDAHRRRPSYNGTAAIVFSRRTTLDYTRFQEYAFRIREGQSRYQSFAAWDHLDLDAITSRPHSTNCDGLLAADYVASAYGDALERNNYGFNDEHFARALAPNAYRPPTSRRLGNGVKVFPIQAEGLLDSDPHLWWIRKVHG